MKTSNVFSFYTAVELMKCNIRVRNSLKRQSKNKKIKNIEKMVMGHPQILICCLLLGG